MSEQPEKTERYKVTEREAGTGRIAYPARESADHDGHALGEAGQCEGAQGEGTQRESAQGAVGAYGASGRAKPVSGWGESAADHAAPLAAGDAGWGQGEGFGGGEDRGSSSNNAAAHGASHAAPRFAAAETEAGAPAHPALRDSVAQMRGLCGNDQVMPLVEAVRLHPLYQEWSRRTMLAERERPFCLHQMAHALDVARIAYIRVLERKMPFRKEVVYAAALLHDIGKAVQYETGEAHELAGARIATQILTDIEGFSALEKTAMVAAVAQHRRYAEESSPLGKLLFEADKASRPCFACPAARECSWSEEKKNAGVKV